MDEPLFRLWSYLGAHPLSGIAATLAAYAAAHKLWDWLGRPSLLNPVLVAIAGLAAALSLTGVSYEAYFEGAQFIHVMLGPATVALALPLYMAARRIREAAGAVLGALIFGALLSAGAAVALAATLGASGTTLASLIPKAVTTPVAMGVAEQIGGLPSLAAVFVLLSGLVGGLLGPWLLRTTGRAAPALNDERAAGFAIGLAAHGIGVSRALERSHTSGAFASLAMALNALATALLAPLLAAWWLVS